MLKMARPLTVRDSVFLKSEEPRPWPDCAPRAQSGLGLRSSFVALCDQKAQNGQTISCPRKYHSEKRRAKTLTRSAVWSGSSLFALCILRIKHPRVIFTCSNSHLCVLSNMFVPDAWLYTGKHDDSQHLENKMKHVSSSVVFVLVEMDNDSNK